MLHFTFVHVVYLFKFAFASLVFRDKIFEIDTIHKSELHHHVFRSNLALPRLVLLAFSFKMGVQFKVFLPYADVLVVFKRSDVILGLLGLDSV